MPKLKKQTIVKKSYAPPRPPAPALPPPPPPPVSNMSVLELPEDVVHRIYEFLPHLVDRIRLASVAGKFRSVFEAWARVKRHVLDIEQLEEMRLPELIVFFKLAGPFVRVLQVDCSSFQKESLLSEFVSEYCPNLEEINYSNANDEFHYRNIMSRMTHLKRVHIECLDTEDVLSFDLEGNQDLESFELVNGCYTGKHLCGFPKLTKMVLRDCLLWNSGEFGIPLKSLRVLDLDDCCFEVMSQSLYQKIAESCINLEELIFSGGDANFEVIAQLPNLQRCTLKTWITSNELNIGFLTHLAENRGNKLTHLHLSGQFLITNEHARCLGQLSSLQDLRWTNNDILEDDHFKFFNDLSKLERFGLTWCGLVGDTGLMRLVRKCLEVKIIDLQDCDEITEEFVINAIGCCSKDPGRYLTINVKNTRITQNILKHPEYLSTQNHVKVNFVKQ